MSNYTAYQPKTWASRELITRTALNHIEQGISDISSEIVRFNSVIDDLTYEPISITSLAINPNVVEKGNEVLTYRITASINKVPTSLIINGRSYEPTQLFTLEEEELSAGEGITSDTTWIFNVTDERDAEDTKSITLSFLNKAYWGAATDPVNINSEFILGLSNSILTDSRARKINVTVGVNKYIWYAVPNRFGACTFNVGGFEGGFTKIDTISYTNASGHTEDYDIYRSDNANLGATSVIIS